MAHQSLAANDVRRPTKRALVIGHFSTVGDIEVLREVECQLAAVPMAYDVGPLSRGMTQFDPSWLDIRTTRPEVYTHLLVVCGPFWRPYYLKCGVNLDAFAHCTRIGINLSMIEDIDAYNPFDRIIGRDNEHWSRPDLSFLREVPKVPVAGLCLVKAQGEYGGRQKHDKAGQLLRDLACRHRLATIELDTEWPSVRNANGFNSPEQFEAVCARLDVMLTTRLHGTVLSLKNGVPAIALDAISGGGKVLRQAAAVGWSEAFSIDGLTDSSLDEALYRCLEPGARQRALACSVRARRELAIFADEFKSALSAAPEGKPSFTGEARPSRASRRFKKIVRKVSRALKRSANPSSA